MKLVIVFFLFLFLSLSTFSSARTQKEEKSRKLGGYTPIPNPNDPHVTEIANYAVTEYDNLTGEKLKLLKVVKAESQLVAGTNYRLTLEVTKTYEAIVYERPWEHFRNLTSFIPLLT